MNCSCKAIWYSDDGYEIYFASERNWIRYDPDGWVHLAVSLNVAKQMGVPREGEDRHFGADLAPRGFAFSRSTAETPASSGYRLIIDRSSGRSS
jgi:hypothetical protein